MTQITVEERDMAHFFMRDARLVLTQDGFETIVTKDDEDPPRGEGWQRVERELDPDDESAHRHYTWRRKALKPS